MSKAAELKAEIKRMFTVDRKVAEGPSGIRKMTEMAVEKEGGKTRGINFDNLNSIGLDFLKRGMDELTGVLARARTHFGAAHADEHAG